MPEGQIMNQPAISIQRLAQRLNVSVRTARRLIHAGELKAHRIGRQWRVFEADIQDYLDRKTNRYRLDHAEAWLSTLPSRGSNTGSRPPQSEVGTKA